MPHSIWSSALPQFRGGFKNGIVAIMASIRKIKERSISRGNHQLSQRTIAPSIIAAARASNESQIIGGVGECSGWHLQVQPQKQRHQRPLY
jgi:hypothetical protein